MIKIIDLFFAARPFLHLPIWSVYFMALIIAGGRSSDLTWWDGLALLSLSMTAAGAFFLNQLYDIESDRINKKLGFLQRGFLTSGQMQAGYLILTLCGLIGAGLVSMLFLTLTALQVTLGYCYSAPKLKFKDRPLAGLVTNAVSFGLLIPLAAAAVRQVCFHAVDWQLGLYFFLTVASMHTLTTIPDRAGDAAADKRTIGVILSFRSAVMTALVLVGLSIYPAVMVGDVALLSLSVISALVTFIALLVKRERLILLAAKLPLALLTLFAGYHYPYYLLFIVALLFLTRIYYRQRFSQTYPKLA
ncbi:MAG TPA: UbiA family prenyltransferase [candidate division Zixibacteria bacterium]|nr:UbiA family prenyltransferase [candidate division Zixibacteria bacterium]